MKKKKEKKKNEEERRSRQMHGCVTEWRRKETHITNDTSRSESTMITWLWEREMTNNERQRERIKPAMHRRFEEATARQTTRLFHRIWARACLLCTEIFVTLSLALKSRFSYPSLHSFIQTRRGSSDKVSWDSTWLMGFTIAIDKRRV